MGMAALTTERKGPHMSDPREAGQEADQDIHEAEEHDQDAEPTKNAPDAGRPDLTSLSEDHAEDPAE
jgi:hypothetical protein